MEWDELRIRFDRLYGTQASDAGLTVQPIDAYQAELLKLYDRWTEVNTEVSLHGDSV
ncbi:hypothetical protein [Paenibacillus contaminans]|uniref:hypothetical protein n=1 Tax=Paenibacillus contaminans TaxID=450362 RepID=UPI001313DF73|nr:hypothetical protein [Paenibacillus contaminans]